MCKFLSTSKASSSCSFTAAFFFPVLSFPAVSFILIETLKLHHSHFQILGTGSAVFGTGLRGASSTISLLAQARFPQENSLKLLHEILLLERPFFRSKKLLCEKYWALLVNSSPSVSARLPAHSKGYKPSGVIHVRESSCSSVPSQLPVWAFVGDGSTSPIFSSWQKKGRLFGASFNVTVWPKQRFMIPGETVASALGFFFFLTFFLIVFLWNSRVSVLSAFSLTLFKCRRVFFHQKNWKQRIVVFKL